LHLNLEGAGLRDAQRDHQVPPVHSRIEEIG
jgi:hypothetical protein